MFNGETMTTREIVDYAHRNGYDSVEFENVIDIGKNGSKKSEITAEYEEDAIEIEAESEADAISQAISYYEDQLNEGSEELERLKFQESADELVAFYETDEPGESIITDIRFTAEKIDGNVFSVRAEVTESVGQSPATVYAVFDGKQVKSAETVTYDNNGNVIPLSERFNLENADIRYSIDEEFETDIDQWEEDGRPEGESFILGSTGDVLQGLGAIESDIYMQGDKIQTILREHPEMSLDEIKKIPEMLDDPVLILKSRNVGRDNAQNTRLVIFGAVRAKNGKPVLSVLDLRPSEGRLIINDMQKVNSAYVKDTDPVGFIRKSEVLYADKKRTIQLLRWVGFQMPTELLRHGSIGSITYEGDDVNISGEKFSKIVRDRTDEARYSIEDDVEALDEEYGTIFKFSNKKTDATQELSRGVTVSGSLADTTSAASNTRVAEIESAVKQKFSFDDED